MDRRHFVQLCSAAALTWGLRGFAGAAEVEDWPAATLVDAAGAPLKAAAVPVGEALVFAYPHAGVPCFLVNLGARRGSALALESPDAEAYTSPPGTGPDAALVAFIAICTHQLTYPNPDVSYMRYDAAGSGTLAAGAPGRIVCCAHGSVFDPARGGEVVSGPAPNPLLPVRLAWNEADDTLQATGTVDPAFFERFFQNYKSELIERFGPGRYRAAVEDTTTAVPLSEYARLVPSC